MSDPERAPEAVGRFKRWTTSFLFVLGTILVCLVILEVALRWMGRHQQGELKGYLAPGGISYQHRPNASHQVRWPTTSFWVYTDDRGIRYRKPGPRQLGERYCAILGSSEVFGNGLDYDQTFAGVLALAMEKDGIDVVNLAVAGHHLKEQAALFKQYAESVDRPPCMVCIILNPLFIGGYDDVHEGLSVRLGQLFPARQWRLPMAKMILSRSLASYGFFRDGIRNVQFKHFQRQDYDLSFYVTRYSTQHRIREPEKTRDFLRELENLEKYIRGLGATPVYLYTPTVGGFQLNRRRDEGKLDGASFDTTFFADMPQQHARAQGIPFISTEPLLQERYDRGEQLHFDLDAHFNGPTSQAMGEYLYRELNPLAQEACR